MSPAIHEAGFADLDVATLYAILRLRVDVFVVEQHCAYPELDGLDADARHYWTTEDGAVLAYVRAIDEGDRRRIGRVVTAASARSRRLARALMEYALEHTAPPWTLSAQTYLRGWYASFGFEEIGAEYVEDGIPHVDMSRLA